MTEWFPFWHGIYRTDSAIHTIEAWVNADSDRVKLKLGTKEIILVQWGQKDKHISAKFKDYLVRNHPNFNPETDEIVPICQPGNALKKQVPDDIDLGF